MKIELDIRSPEDVAADELSEAMTAASMECGRRIVAVWSVIDQVNLAAEAASGALSEDQIEIYRSGLAWVKKMRATWTKLAVDGEDISDDANWPDAPDGLRSLTAAH